MHFLCSRLLAVFRFYSPLRSLLREASNQSSDSVVCFGTLRPLRSLREVCLRAVMSFFARRLRRERRVLFADVFHAGAGGVANFVTTTLSSYPLPLRVLPLSQGEKGGWEHFL